MTTQPSSYTWRDIHVAAQNVAIKLQSVKEEFDTVLGIARGGAIPAAILAYELGIPNISTIQITSYEGTERSRSHFCIDSKYVLTNLSVHSKNVLVVDDLSDSGQTFLDLNEQLNMLGVNYKTAALYIKPNTEYVPDFYYQEVNDWVVFPWEQLRASSSVG